MKKVLKIIGIIFLIFIVIGIIGSISNPNSKKLNVQNSFESGFKKGEEVLKKEEPTKKEAEPTLTNTEKHDALFKEWHKYCDFEIEDAVCICVWEKLFDQYNIDDMREIITDEKNSMIDRKIMAKTFNECRAKSLVE